MILITKTEQEKTYQMPEMPNFQHRRLKVVWLNRQKVLAATSNIKSVSVQVKDIKYMIYSKNPRLISLNAKFYLNNSSSSYNDNDYITISKSNNLNKSLIYALISADWLLDIETLEKKSIEELRQECIDLQNKICELSERKKQLVSHDDIDYEIKLCEYKLSCLSEYALNKENSESSLSQTTIERVLLKDKKYGNILPSKID